MNNNTQLSESDCLKWIIESNADNDDIPIFIFNHAIKIGFVDKSYYNDLLIYCAEHNKSLQWISAIIEAGADINAKDDNGYTPLMFASRYGNKDIVEYLHQTGADINAKNENGNTPLMFASKYDKIDVVEYLHKAGADINAKNYSGLTPLMIASIYGNKDIVKYLYEVGADIHAKDNNGYTVSFLLTSYYGKKDIVEYLEQFETDKTETIKSPYQLLMDSLNSLNKV